MIVEISKRLQKIAGYVPLGTDVVVDIGTDHGYIPIYLIKNKMAKKCIACDINPMPLKNAQGNIKAYKMSEQIETRLSNGLAKIKVGEPDIIIAAGMGGMLIIDILRENPDVVKATGLLILQPQLDAMALRKYIHLIGFKIIEDQMLCEDGRYYTIIVAEPGKESPYSEREYFFGKKIIQAKELVFKDFISYKIKDLNILKDKISKSKTQRAQDGVDKINKELWTYEEMFKCL